ncbi:MAG: hypothetical protein ISS57_14790 [Anaerolineales bacterium]|nr:hypothetical protein [Anaerolineales bacterium]
MKWHFVCLAVIVWMFVSPHKVEGSWVDVQDSSRIACKNRPQVPENGHSDVFARTQWQTVVGLYGVYHFGKRWRLVTRSRRTKKRPLEKSVPSRSASEPVQNRLKPVAADTGNEPDTLDEEGERIPFRMVLRPGVLLTRHGIQLRPMIARLGKDASEYLALWQDKDRFKADIAHLLRRSCPLCEGESGFGCISSDKRSVIPVGEKNRVWFRVQKIACQDCGRITRILPTFCIPYKSHHAQTIQNALENCWRRNNSYRDTTGIINQTRPADGQYQGHTLPYEWTIWLGGLAIHLPQFLVWLGLRLPRHGLLDEYFMEQDNDTDNHRIFAVTVQDPESTAIWNIVRVDRNDTEAFKQTLQHLRQVGIQLRAITSDGWPAILRAVREELAGAIHLLCYFHAKKNVFETLEKYRRAKKCPKDAPELSQLCRAFFDILEAPDARRYRARLRKLTKQVADEPILLARCRSFQKKSHYNTLRLRSPLLAATTSLVELSFKFLTRKAESMYSFRKSRCNAAQKSLIVWALVRDFVPYLPGAKYAGRSPAELAGVDLDGLPWLQFINLKLSEGA